MLDTRCRPSRSASYSLALALGILCGCASIDIAGGPASWQQAMLAEADTSAIPRYTNSRVRVLVLASEDSPSAQGADLPGIASAALENALAAGGVEVIDNALGSQLERALKFAEVMPNGPYSGPEVADYVIRVQMGEARWNSIFEPPSSYKNPLTGRMVEVPGGYVHRAVSSMSVRIYHLPSLKLVGQYPIEGTARLTAQTDQGGPDVKLNMVREATVSGIRRYQDVLLTEFAPKGYVIEKRTKDDKAIFRVLLGKQTGAKAGERVEILTRRSVDNRVESIPVGVGRLSDIASDSGSWIVVDDPKQAAAIRKFDEVRVVRNDNSWMANFRSSVHSLPPGRDLGTDNPPPAFPWPPPAASAQMVVPDSAFTTGGARATLGDLNKKLAGALTSQGYTARSYFVVPDGFAVVTRLEKFGAGGAPAAGEERWSTGNTVPQRFTLEGYLASLFSGEPGRFRVLVFVVTSHPFAATGTSPSRRTTLDWLGNGFDSLPRTIANASAPADIKCTVLIYEFLKPPGGSARFVAPGHLDGGDHVRGSGVITAMERP